MQALRNKKRTWEFYVVRKSNDKGCSPVIQTITLPFKQ
jgi:hypothetical protein